MKPKNIFVLDREHGLPTLVWGCQGPWAGQDLPLETVLRVSSSQRQVTPAPGACSRRQPLCTGLRERCKAVFSSTSAASGGLPGHCKIPGYKVLLIKVVLASGSWVHNGNLPNTTSVWIPEPTRRRTEVVYKLGEDLTHPG